MEKIVTCDVCGIELDAEDANFDIGSQEDLCDEHFRQRQLLDAKQERDSLAAWLEATFLKRLREIDARIAELEKVTGIHK